MIPPGASQSAQRGRLEGANDRHAAVASDCAGDKESKSGGGGRGVRRPLRHFHDADAPDGQLAERRVSEIDCIVSKAEGVPVN